MDGIHSSQSYSNIPDNSISQPEAKKLETPEEHQTLLSSPQNPMKSELPEHYDLPELQAQPIVITLSQRSPEEFASRKQENAEVTKEEKLIATLQKMGKGVDKPPPKLSAPLTAAKKFFKKIKDNKENIAKEIPLGPGFTIESVMEHKEASACKKEAKSIEKELHNPTLSKRERKDIGKNLKNMKNEKKELFDKIVKLDRNMAKEFKTLVKSGQPPDQHQMAAHINEREGLMASVFILDQDIQATRRTLYSSDLSPSELDDRLGEMDQKVKEQQQHERKGYGHGSRGTTLIAYNTLSAGKIVTMGVDVGTASSALTPVTAGVGLLAGGVGGTLHVRNIVKAKTSKELLKAMSYEAVACEARAWYHNAIANDATVAPETREVSKAMADIEMERSVLIKDYVHIHKTMANRKMVSNGIGLAENAALVTACTFSLLTLIPEPVTSATMYGLSLGTTGVKFVLMLTEWGYEIGIEIKEEKHEEKLHNRRDFGPEEIRTHVKGMSKSQLGVEIRLAHMILNGLAPKSMIKHHGIVDETGFVKFVMDVTRHLGEKQEYKKGLGHITDYNTIVGEYYKNLAAQAAGRNEPKEDSA